MGTHARAGPSTYGSQPQTSTDAQDVLPMGTPGGQNRRLTMLFVDVVDSTALSCRVEPETYWTVVGSYRRLVLEATRELGGYIGFTKGDGLLVIFGHPVTHDNDVHRAVALGLRVTEEVARLSTQVNRRFGFPISARVGIHRGMVYLDTDRDEVYGGAVSLTQWLSGRAEPGTVVVSDAVASLVSGQFELRKGTAAYIDNTESAISYHRVLDERAPQNAGKRGTMVSILWPSSGRASDSRSGGTRRHRSRRRKECLRGVRFPSRPEVMAVPPFEPDDVIAHAPPQRERRRA